MTSFQVLLFTRHYVGDEIKDMVLCGHWCLMFEENVVAPSSRVKMSVKNF